jgi:2-polyprenyl-6-methoxyphenol hydroxylase-like FAD-dependent oxidoreductase
MYPFKVIIVGGGPSGIIAAHALHQAGIDFVVLERRQNVFEDTGASLVLSPQNLRVFHQLGILDQFIHLGAPLLHLSQSFSPTSKSFTRTHSLSRIQDKSVLFILGIKCFG